MFAFSKISVLLIVVAGQVQSANVSVSTANSNAKNAEGKVPDPQLNVVIENGDSPLAEKPLAKTDKFGYACLPLNKKLIFNIFYLNSEIFKPVIHTTTNFGVYLPQIGETYTFNNSDKSEICFTWGTWFPQEYAYKSKIIDVFINFITDTAKYSENLLFMDISVDVQVLGAMIGEKAIPKPDNNKSSYLPGPMISSNEFLIGPKLFKNIPFKDKYEFMIGNVDIVRDVGGRLNFVLYLSENEREFVKKAANKSMTEEDLKSPHAWNNIDVIKSPNLCLKFQPVKAAENEESKNILI